MSVANKIVAELPDGVAPGAVAMACQQGISERLHALRDEALDPIHKTARDHLDRRIADLQIDDLIEAQWVSVDYRPGHYAEARLEAEQLLLSAKQTRLWGPVPWSAAHPKSSLDGFRESVIDQRVHGLENRNEHLRGRLGLDVSEHLCGIGMLKRHGRRIDPEDEPDDSHQFFSIPHLAAIPLLDRMKDLDSESKLRVEQRWTEYLGALQANGAWLDETVPKRCREPILGCHDGQLLYEGRIAERFEHLDETKGSAAVKRVLPSLRALLDALGPGGAPCPYIAILVADGDHMGNAIGRQNTPDGHRSLSAALDGFSQGTRKIVEDARGQLIYAGGDDVLAFVPLHRALDCAQALRLRFAEVLKPFGDLASSPTLSVGIGICHFMEPMTRSLNVARAAEKLAKRERDSLAIIVDKRSGAPISVCNTWGKLDETLTTLIKLHLEDKIPDKLTHDLEALTHLQASPPGESHDILAEIAAHEFKQILRQKRGSRGHQPISDEVRGQLVNNDKAEPDPLPQPDAQLASCLLVAQLLARAQQAANPGFSP
jgi:CRISPR-associated protein Cmr2